MSFQWLQMRISEEQDRRRRQSLALERLPRALEELHRGITACLEAYTAAFGGEAAEVQLQGARLRIVVREEMDGRWEQVAKVEVNATPSLPGFEIERGGAPYQIQVGLLPNDKLFYRDCHEDQYLTMDEMTRRILDRALFPKLSE
jgi:hypothetical protein